MQRARSLTATLYQSPLGLSLRANETLGLSLTQFIGPLLEKKRRELHRLEAHAAPLPHLGRDLLQPFQRPRRERDQTPFGPTGVRRSAAARRLRPPENPARASS